MFYELPYTCFNDDASTINDLRPAALLYWRFDNLARRGNKQQSTKYLTLTLSQFLRSDTQFLRAYQYCKCMPFFSRLLRLASWT